jgi:polyphosphate glucokinase
VAVLGVDIGGSSIKAALVDLVDGDVVDEPVEAETPQPAPPAVLTEVVMDLIQPLVGRADGPVGCTFPGRIRAGTSLTAVNLAEEWVGERPGDHLESAIGRPFVVINDADAAGIAELAFGAGAQRPGVILVVTLGTGIGTAVFVDGTLLPNSELGDVSDFLQRMQDLIDPDLIIVGGGVSEHPERLGGALRQPVQVVPAALGNAAGIIGAALNASRVGDASS